jgi:hypothetical protein
VRLLYKLNTFSTYFHCFQVTLKYWLKPLQVVQISVVQFGLDGVDDLNVLHRLTGEQACKSILDFLSRLKRIHVLVFDPTNTIRPFDEDCKKNIGRLNALNNGRFAHHFRNVGGE